MKDLEKFNSDMAIGVVICKLQTPDLHDGHHGLINHALSKHGTVVVFLGIAPTQFVDEFPFDFQIRRDMVASLYPNVIILPMNDNPDDYKWSSNIDSTLRSIFPEKACVLYGSRDSFIPHYHGKHITEEFPEIGTHNATELRFQAKIKPINSRRFRKGVIFGISKQRPVTYPTVDITVLNNEGLILLVRKPSEKLFRFAGGFVDREDENYEQAASRELYEETKLNAHRLVYVASQAIDDWRYRRTKSGIMTTLFLSHDHDLLGRAEASDDLAGGEVKWFDPKTLFKTSIQPKFDEEAVTRLKYEFFLDDKIEPVHLELMKTFLKFLNENYLTTRT